MSETPPEVRVERLDVQMRDTSSFLRATAVFGLPEIEHQKDTDSSTEASPVTEPVSEEEATEQDQVLANRQKRYREMFPDDYLNKYGVSCFDVNMNGQVFVRIRFTSLFTTQNLIPSITANSTPLIHFHNDIEDFFHFVTHSSGQGSRDWGNSLNLVHEGSRQLVLEHEDTNIAASEFLEDALLTEATTQNNLLNLIKTIQTSMGWKSKRPLLGSPNVAGGFVAYAACDRDVTRDLPCAVASKTDVALTSPDGKRTIVVESKKDNEILTAHTGAGFSQLLASSLGAKADVGIHWGGNKFGLYWFPKTREGAVQMHKLLPTKALYIVDRKELIDIAAHLAFLVSDPCKPCDLFSPKRLKFRDAASQCGEPDIHRIPKTLTQNSPDLPPQRAPVSDQQRPQEDDVWDKIVIEGRKESYLTCYTLHEQVKARVHQELFL